MTKKTDSRFLHRIICLAIFAVAMGYLESAVVVYLRQLYYPEGFAYPLKNMPSSMAMLEIGREASTIIMLVAVAIMTARGLWTRFAHFMFIFGIWDIAYYFWLKIAINWPRGLFDADILFLIPTPWVGPVLAPVLVSALMIVSGFLIAKLSRDGISFRPGIGAWVAALIGVIVILYTFMRDGYEIAKGTYPSPYLYWLYAIGLGFCLLGFMIAYFRSKGNRT